MRAVGACRRSRQRRPRWDIHARRAGMQRHLLAHLAGGDTISPAGISAVDIARIVPAPDPVV
ncbi:hypothetical protein XFF6992_20036 [Xanthomonas citri pv. fuscans]|nr:hypothetical protein XFF6992_20036 [Xanthomonas citri pv. fuscans]